jgi:hypothetical protein
MDSFHDLVVRFHYKGKFINYGNDLCYCGGSEGMSHIDSDKMSLPEVRGHLEDHCKDLGMVLMYWLLSDTELKNGLKALTDDNGCQKMCDSIIDGVIADIFVESLGVDVCSDGEAAQEVVHHGLVNRPLSATVQEIAQKDNIVSTSDSKEKILTPITNDQEDNTLCDYLPGDDDNSDADEEAAENKVKYKDFKKYMQGEYLVFADGDNKGMTKKDVELFPVDNLSYESDTSYF